MSTTESEEDRRNRTAGERAVSFIGYMAGATLEEVNEQLERDANRAGGSPRSMVEGSFKTYGSYAKRFGLDDVDQPTWRKMWEHITGPKWIGNS